MANASKHPCAQPFCKVLLPKGVSRCEKHQQQGTQHYEQQRESSTARGYNHKWRKLRNVHLLNNPLCVEHLKQGQFVQATDVDHIIAHKGDLTLFYDENNLQSLCHSCHSRKTALEDGRWGQPKAVPGCADSQ
jgi:5-methylcytosine-specific restriction protein A